MKYANSAWLGLSLLVGACSGRSMLGSSEGGTSDGGQPDTITAHPDLDATTAIDSTVPSEATATTDVNPPPDTGSAVDASSEGDVSTPLYEPCRGKTCGDPCTLCDPAAAAGSCVETQVVRHCNAIGSCTATQVSCESTCSPGCIPDVSWGFHGGRVVFTETSSIGNCNIYTHTLEWTSGTNSPVTCVQPIDNPPPTCVIGAANAVLANPDVVAALAASPVLYGEDVTQVDGSNFRLAVSGKTIDVGADCRNGVSNCKPIPPGVKAAVDFFQALDRSQLSQPSCKSAFPDWCSTHCAGSNSPALVCGADGVDYPDSTVAGCCGAAVAHAGVCGNYSVTDFATDAIRKAISKADPVRGLCFRLVLVYSISRPNLGIVVTPNWNAENAWVSHNIAECNAVGGPLSPAGTEIASSGAGRVTVAGGGGGGSRCSFSVRATLNFPTMPSEALVADGLDAGFCP